MRRRMGKCFVNFQVQWKLQDDCNLFSLMGIITLTMNYEIGFFFKYLFIYLLGCFPTRDQTHVFCVGRQIPNHWTTREVPEVGCLCLVLLW